MYRIALGKFFHGVLHLHPSHKLAYLQNAGWSEEWIATAKEIVKMEFKWAYAGIDSEENGEDVVCSVTSPL